MRFYTQTERLSEDNKHEREGFEQIQSEQSKLYNQWIESNETLLPFFKGSMEAFQRPGDDTAECAFGWV